MSQKIAIERVLIKNYKSIARCDVQLGSLHFLVGPNGAGKSNFLDALRFIADALNNPLEFALRERGGISEVRRRSGGHPTHFGIHVWIRISPDESAEYLFQIGSKKGGGFEVQHEQCNIHATSASGGACFEVSRGKLTEKSEQLMPPAAIDRLYLPTAASLPQFRSVFDILSQMSFYNLRPEVIRDLQSPDQGDRLRRDGGNLASVLGSISKNDKQSYQRILSFLAKILSGVKKVESKQVSRKETLLFTQQTGDGDSTWQFYAENMSDGTLRALGVLTALFQATRENGKTVSLIGIEEPELAVHPFAAAVLRDALRVASASVQVIVTSHSPDILDDSDIQPESILGVVSDGAGTSIAPLDAATRSVLKEKLFTAGELLRMNQLIPESGVTTEVKPDQLDLFEDEL